MSVRCPSLSPKSFLQGGIYRTGDSGVAGGRDGGKFKEGFRGCLRGFYQPLIEA
jgi:hypothetical protein